MSLRRIGPLAGALFFVLLGSLAASTRGFTSLASVVGLSGKLRAVFSLPSESGVQSSSPSRELRPGVYELERPDGNWPVPHERTSRCSGTRWSGQLPLCAGQRGQPDRGFLDQPDRRLADAHHREPLRTVSRCGQPKPRAERDLGPALNAANGAAIRSPVRGRRPRLGTRRIAVHLNGSARGRGARANLILRRSPVSPS